MKQISIFKALLVSLIYLSSNITYAIATDPLYTVNQETIAPFIRALYKKTFDRLLSVYDLNTTTFYAGSYDPVTDKEIDFKPFGEKNAENEAVLRTHLKEAFETAWQESLTSFENNIPILQNSAEAVAQFKENVGKLITIYIVENNFKGIMITCECIPIAERISFAFIFAEDILTTFPDRNQPLVITAFASGLLLQEYLLLTLLTAYGYNNIIINLVDFGYPDPVMLQRVLNATGTQDARRAIKHFKLEVLRAAELETANKEMQQDWLTQNKKLFPELAGLIGDQYFSGQSKYQRALDILKKIFPSVIFNNYKNLQQYIEIVKRNPALKANALSIVDPDLEVFQVAPFPSEATMLGITDTSIAPNNQKIEPHIYVTLTKEQPVQIYAHADTYDLNPSLAALVETLRAKAIETGSDKKYNIAFRDWIIENYASYSSKRIEKIRTKNTAAILKQAAQGALDPKQLQKILTETLAINEAALATPEHSYKLAWYSDPHVAFQQLVRDTAKDDAIIYLYYKIDTPIGTDLHFEKVSKANYINRDVFGPIVGKVLVKSGTGTIESLDDTESSNASSSDAESINNYDDTTPNTQLQYGLVDFALGELLRWDQIKNQFPEEVKIYSDAEIAAIYERNDIVPFNDDEIDNNETPYTTEDETPHITIDQEGNGILDLSSRNLSQVPELNNISGIESAKYIFLGNNEISEILNHALDALTNAGYIDLSNNPIKHLNPEALRSLPNLYSINLDNVALSEENIRELKEALPRVNFWLDNPTK